MGHIQKRRGLVLQGGGAKGAFQYGVLKELHSAGFEFDVISGTSVGALNASLVATDSWDQGDLLWTNLSLKSAFSWRKFSSIYTAISLPGILFFGWATNQFEEAIGRPVSFVFALVASLPSLAFIGWLSLVVLDSTSLYERIFLGVWLLALACFAVVGMFKKQSWYRPTVTIGFATLLPLWLGMAFFQGLPVLKFISGAPLESAGFTALSLSPILMIVGLIHRYFNVSLLSNSPLNVVVTAVASRPFLRPLLATTAELVPEYVDPDYFGYTRVQRGPLWVPVLRSGFLPQYNRIDTMTTHDAVAALLASAALPLGIVPNVLLKKNKARVVDGGLADNIPWQPLINEYACTEIVIILCEPVHSEHMPTLAIWQSRERLGRVMRSGYRPANFTAKTPWSVPIPMDVKNNPPNKIPMPTLRNGVDMSRVKVTLIGPPKPLGGLISATMNFDATRALKNIKAGSDAAKAAIAAGLTP